MQSDKVGAALVVGGGIGGMQASLDLANAGIKVYLVEQTPCVGGVMAQLDKTFPTNDCAMCTMAPRLADLSRHKDIELLTLADVTQVTGGPGRFNVTVRKRPRYIDTSRCKGCGLCTSVCPVTQSSEFDLGLVERKAIYLPFPQAVPNVFAISRRGTAPCQAGCPIHQSAQGYVTLVAQGRFEEALQVILRDNPLPSICGRVCTHPCTAACTRGSVDDPVNLPALKRFVTDRFPNYELPQSRAPERAEKIAIVGSGPAGLLCAHGLRQKGYRPTVYESLPVAGGMLAVGIPSFRLPRPVLAAEIDRLRASGIDIKLNTAIGRTTTLEDLRRDHAAVFLAIGAHVERKLRIPGEDLPGVTGAVEFLRRVQLEGPELPGRRVLVIGGGNSALDAARTARRCGADKVTIVYRRTRAEMPADHREIEDAEREGVGLRFLTAPVSAQAATDGRVGGLQCLKMKLGPPDSSGRPAPEPMSGSEFVIPCDAVIVTIGQSPDLDSLGERMGLEATKWGTLHADPVTLETALPGVFAGGDCVSGPDVIVTAMLAGKKAANSIGRFLNGQDMRAGRELEGPFAPEYVVDTAGVLVRREIAVPALSPAMRVTAFDEVHTGYSEEQAKAEAARCLACAICCDCELCATACDANAIDYLQKEEMRELQVGAIILAPGYDLFDARGKRDLGFGRFRNVVSAAQFERVLSASGPFMGHIVRPSDQVTPRRIAFIQCVGSRDAERDYCSSVCCMYATKEALIAKEHCGEALETDIFFMDARAYGKGFEAYYNRALAQGVNYIRCRPPVLEEVAATGNVVIRYVTDDDTKAEREYDLVVLATGMLPPRDAPGLAKTFGIALNEFGFCKTTTFEPVESSRAGVFVCGPFTEPKDIPETVMQASGAASKVLALLRDVRGTLIAPRVYPPETDVTGQEPRVGVFVCHCGTNIAGVVDVASVAEYARGLPNVVHSETNLYSCSTDTLERIKEKIREHGLNRVVVASCSPRTHEPLFRSACREAGLNPYLFEMANIRDQCSWVHMHEPERATQKSKDLVRMALAKARLLEPLQKGTAPVTKAALVVGGGLAGMVSALNIAEQGYEVCLVEREAELGGNARRLHNLGNGDDPQATLGSLVSKVHANGRIRVLTQATVQSVDGSVGSYKSTIAHNGSVDRFDHGVVVVATGGKEHQPKEHLYGEDQRVLTQFQLEERLATRGGMDIPSTVVMIQCVGSRDAERPYCSRICCTEAVKNALKIKELSPQTNVYVLHRDIRTYGFRESLYTRARQLGVVFLRHEDDRKPVVTSENGGLVVTVFDPQLKRDIVIEAGLVVLSVATVPHDENKALAQTLKVPLNQDGFFLEAHMKLRPVDFATEGIFLAGLAHSPKSVDETIAQAAAASARAGGVLSQDALELEATVSSVVEENCDGCAYCVDPCPYKAITLVEYVRDGEVRKRIRVNESLCKGCGTCQATCPKRGIFVRGFTLDQIAAQVTAALEVA
jgi:heterodisulfide reductase subunit A-like polyferredoxin